MDDFGGSAALAARVLDLAAEAAGREDLRGRSRNLESQYDLDAPDYDKANAGAYLSPERVAALVVEHVGTGGEAPILDLACGTGFLGERLRARGFANLTGADLSAGMLQRAEAKAVYRRLLRADLHEPLPLPVHGFAAVTCVGAFYEDLVAVHALAHVLPVIRPGGHLICDVEAHAWEAGGFRRVFECLAEEGWLTLPVCRPDRMFALGYMGEDDVDEGPQGVFLVARMAGE